MSFKSGNLVAVVGNMFLLFLRMNDDYGTNEK
eukprot:UN09626